MKTNLELLNTASRYAELMGYEFYCISIRKNEITYQGSYDSNLVKHLTGCGYTGCVDKNGYFTFEYYEGDDLRNEKITIVLT